MHIPQSIKVINQIHFKDETMLELGQDKVTGQGRWLLDYQDQQFIERRAFPKRCMIFVCLGSGFKPFWEFIEPVGRKDRCSLKMKLKVFQTLSREKVKNQNFDNPTKYSESVS